MQRFITKSTIIRYHKTTVPLSTVTTLLYILPHFNNWKRHKHVAHIRHRSLQYASSEFQLVFNSTETYTSVISC